MLNSYISGSHNELVLVTLKLFNSISAFGSGRERKSVFEAFSWDSKVRLALHHHPVTYSNIESTEITTHAQEGKRERT